MRKLSYLFAMMTVIIILTGCGTSATDNKTDDREKDMETQEKNEQNNNAEKVGKEKMTYPQLSLETAENEKLVEMKTNMGAIQIKLFPEQAPKTVENFITHSKNGYYEGITFHRVMNEFMIQGGDPNGTGMGGESIYGSAFEDEFSDQLFHFRGALSMANAGPNTNGSQFFIVQNSEIGDLEDELKKAGYPEEVIEAYKSGGTPWLDFKHTVFGQVIAGMDVVDKIANVPTDPRSNKPLEDVIIEKIDVLKE